MKNNSELKTDVQNAIRWVPLLNDAEISVSVRDGVVYLTGCVDCYIKKLNAEHAAKKVIGVTDLVENIEVKIPRSWVKTDLEIKHEVQNALKFNWIIPHDKLSIYVEDGWLTLTGVLTWNFQRETTLQAASYIMGVRGITNDITIKAEMEMIIEQKDVEKALALSWTFDDHDINVKVSGTIVTLTGTVNSWQQKEEAGRIVWNTPGISQLNNDLEIDYYFDLLY